MAYKSELLTYYESFGQNRAAELARLNQIISAGGTAIIAALPGFGKSHASRLMAAEVKRRGGSVIVVVCSRSQPDQLDDRGTGPADLLIVEDAHLLDLDDIRRLSRLAMDETRSVLITLDPAPPSSCPREQECRREMKWLWSEGGVERIDLGGVGYDEAQAIIDAVPSAKPLPIDVVTKARILMLADGNPRLLEELTREELYRGTYSARQQNLLLGPSQLSPRIIDFVRPRLQDLGADEEYGLITLGRLGSTPFLRATRIIGHGPLRSLLRRGLVAHDPRTPDCVAVSQLYAGAALALQVEENPFEAQHAAETVILHDASKGTHLSASECAFVAEYLMNNPSHDPLEDMTIPEVAELFARAARRANENGMPGSAMMFAHRSLAYSPTAKGVEELSRCLVKQGKFVEALNVIEKTEVPHGDAIEDAKFLSWWMQVLVKHNRSKRHLELMDAEARSWGTVDGVLDEWNAFMSARAAMMLTNYADGVRRMERIASDESTSATSVLRALAELMPCYVYLGRTNDFESALNSGRGPSSPEISGLDGPRRRDRTGHVTEFIMQASFVRAASGHDRAALAREIESYALRMVDTADEYGMALVNLAAGHLAIEQTQGRRAEAELRRALERVGNGTQTRWTTWMQVLRANALAMIGRHDDALLVEREIRIMARESTPWLSQYSMHLDARMKAYEGDLAGSIAECRAIASMNSPHSRFFSTRALHVAAALGDNLVRIIGQLDALPQGDPAPSTLLLEGHLRSTLEGDADALEAIGTELLSLDFWWEGALALQTASQLYAEAGRYAEKRRSDDKLTPFASRLAEITNGHPNPGDQPTAGASIPRTTAAGTAESVAEARDQVSPRFSSLTSREREITLLAADGHSNAEIAARLFLSVRTVESHILQARSKLGAVRRADLASVIPR
ncbi:LuxR family transcriptional regulator [Agreia sp. COWG]|uniref:helix-turn-helix transcriptional regulator n=1 Tax=Agreia sp. COWG TaxID=2773266 RepID=UPI001927B1AB|nr:LuxR family transcriptional regulator [Agreia sp. COWG]